MRYLCKDCGKMFDITPGEAEFFKSKGLDLPKRCKECRAKNKNGKTANKKPASTQPVKENPTKKKSNGNGKFIKTLISAVIFLLIVIVCAKGLPELFSDAPTENLVTTQPAVYVTDDADVTNDADATDDADVTDETAEYKDYYFANDSLLTQHYNKHGIEMGFASKEEYQSAASAVVNNPGALHKLEAEDGDDVYYLEATNEFVIVSTKGYIRTYFNPNDGLDYFNRQ